MAVEDVVRVLSEYCEDGAESFGDRHGPEAVIAVRDLIDVLRVELGGQLDYDTLWAEFEEAPRETAADLAGALEAMIEADPGLAEKLEALMEEYYATSRPAGNSVGAEMPESDTSEFVSRREDRIERHEVEPRSHTDVAGEGTYLYGNVRSGDDVTFQKALEVGPDVLEVRRELETLSFDVDGLFQQLRVTVDEEMGLSDEVKNEVRQALKALQTEIMLGGEADEDAIVTHLRHLGELDPDLLALVLTGLRRARTEAQAVVQGAIERTVQS